MAKPKINVDELVQKMLEHADKYPELKMYADGLKEIYRRSIDEEPKKEGRLTQKTTRSTISEPESIHVGLKDTLSVLGV